MSLINEALKKAQRQRSHEQAEANAPASSGEPAVRRKPPRTAEATLLISAAAVVLVVLSVVLTVYLLNRPAPPAEITSERKNTPAPAASTDETSTSPVVVARIAERAATPGDAGTSTTPADSPAAANATVATPVPSKSDAPPGDADTAPGAAPAADPGVAHAPAVAGGGTPPASTESSPPAAAPKLPPKANERAHAYVDALRVTGIRASGEDSRVLMNERVYRVNDIVERTLGLRLVKVDTDHLTFEDANGATYVKYF